MRARALDFDLHGVVGLRLLDASPSDAAAARRRFGRLERPLDRLPDVVVRFVDEVPAAALRHVEWGRTGFTDDAFVVLQPHEPAPLAALALDTLGERCEITCRRGVRSVPLLPAVVMATALRRGCVPLHASAFEYRGVGILAAGWAHGGKTSALLAFGARGAGYVGDDLVLLRADGSRMFGLPTPLDLWEWQAAGLPAVRARAGAARLALARAAGGVERVARGNGAARLIGRASAALRRRLRVEVPLPVVFGDRVPLAAEPGVVFLMVSHEARDVRVEPADPMAVAERLAVSLEAELLDLTAHHLAYRFAFPGRRSELLESVPGTAAALLRRALAGCETYVVWHPRPVPLAELYRAMRPHCEAPCPVAG